MERKIYVVLSQTGTILSRALKFATGAEYNHASISLTPDLDKMYSFGRLNPYNPFRCGFVEEGIDHGTFKRFKKTRAAVIELSVTEDQYSQIKYFIEYFNKHKPQFNYNYMGLIYAIFKKDHAPKNKFYCSQFVRTCLAFFNIENAQDLPSIIKPIDFMKLTNKTIIYEGLLRNYKN